VSRVYRLYMCMSSIAEYYIQGETKEDALERERRVREDMCISRIAKGHFALRDLKMQV